MGAAGLLDIKRRIKSVESTRKITKAMGLVATSKLRKTRKELVSSQEHYKLCKDIVDDVLATLDGYDNQSIYFTSPNKEAKKLYVVLASETGLCGGFNGNVAEYLNQLVSLDKEDAAIVVVGSKGIPYVKKHGFKDIKEYVDIKDIPTIKDIKKIYQDIIYSYKEGLVSEINLVYTEFLSPVKQIPKFEKLLPIEKAEKKSSNLLIEPNVDEVLESCLEILMKSNLRRCLLNSKCSEQSSRMTAMDGATKNADDLIKNLKIKFNRIRQGMITQEISEIVGGAEAQR